MESPAQWHVGGIGGCRPRLVYDASGRTILRSWGSGSDEENEANAQLAAQAPRLREDVKTLRIALRVIRESATNSDDIEKMRAEMLEICGIASRALEATKEGA